MYFIVFVFVSILSSSLFSSSMSCKLPNNLLPLEDKNSRNKYLNNSDLKRNAKQLKKMCIHILSFKENHHQWKMILLYNPNRVKGPFWFLPHDDENTAFDSAVYATQKYGGGFLAVLSKNNRYFQGQDPNRNFGASPQATRTCNQQKYPAPLYSKYVFDIIDTFRKKGLPYLSIHNNKNGWYGNGGSGSISISKKSSITRSFPSGVVLIGGLKGIKDEDSLIYIAGTSTTPPISKLKPLLDAGMHTKYEIVNKNNNDCSMSNYAVLNKGGNYYNIETEKNDGATQKIMINKLMKIIVVGQLYFLGNINDVKVK